MRLINADELTHILNLNKNEMSPKACEVIDLVIDIVNQMPTVETTNPVENVDIRVENRKMYTDNFLKMIERELERMK